MYCRCVYHEARRSNCQDLAHERRRALVHVPTYGGLSWQLLPANVSTLSVVLYRERRCHRYAGGTQLHCFPPSMWRNSEQIWVHNHNHLEENLMNAYFGDHGCLDFPSMADMGTSTQINERPTPERKGSGGGGGVYRLPFKVSGLQTYRRWW